MGVLSEVVCVDVYFLDNIYFICRCRVAKRILFKFNDLKLLHL